MGMARGCLAGRTPYPGSPADRPRPASWPGNTRQARRSARGLGRHTFAVQQATGDVGKEERIDAILVRGAVGWSCARRTRTTHRIKLRGAAPTAKHIRRLFQGTVGLNVRSVQRNGAGFLEARSRKHRVTDRILADKARLGRISKRPKNSVVGGSFDTQHAQRIRLPTEATERDWFRVGVDAGTRLWKSLQNVQARRAMEVRPIRPRRASQGSTTSTPRAGR